MFARMSSGVICSPSACACHRKKKRTSGQVRQQGFVVDHKTAINWSHGAEQEGQIGQEVVRSCEHVVQVQVWQVIKAKVKLLCKASSLKCCELLIGGL